MSTSARLLLALGATLLSASFSWAQFQDTTFRVRQKNWNLQATSGECTIRVMVDDEVDVELQGDQVRIRVVAGQPGKDDGSECTQPLPADITKFEFKGIDGRGEVRLVQEPRSNNYWTAVVNIKDKKGGQEGYTYRLRWESRYGAANYNPNSGYNSPGYNNSNRPGGGFGNSGNWGSGDLSVSPQGDGAIRRGNRNELLNRMDINVRGDGTLSLSAYGDGQYQSTGRWRESGDGLDLSLDDGASGRITFRGGLRRRNIDRVEINGGSGRFGNYNLRFTASGSAGGTTMGGPGNNQGGWWGNNNSGVNNGSFGNNMSLSQSGRGSVDVDGRNWNVTAVSIDGRNSRDVLIRMTPDRGRDFEFHGSVARQSGSTVELDLFDSSEGRATGKATLVTSGSNGVDNLRIDANANGRRVRGDFRR